MAVTGLRVVKVHPGGKLPPLSSTKPMHLSERVQKDLWVGGLMSSLNFCQTAGGGEHLGTFAEHPLRDRPRIIEIQDIIETLLKNTLKLTALKGPLKESSEGERLFFEERNSLGSRLNGLKMILKASMEVYGLLTPFSDNPTLAKLRAMLNISRSPNLRRALRALERRAINISYSFENGKLTINPYGRRSNINHSLEKHEEMVDYLGQYIGEVNIGKVMWALGWVDYYFSMAMAAHVYGLVRPEIVEDGRVQIMGGMHPTLLGWWKKPKRFQDPFFDKQVKRVVPNDTDVSPDKNVLVLTGPNTCGKTTYIVQLGLLSVMAQMGSFIPARKGQRPVMTIYDNIYTLFGGEGELGKESTFQAEVNALREILPKLNRRSLLICDEIFRTTEPESAQRLTCGTLAYLASRVGVMAIATHYVSGLEELAKMVPGLQILQVMGKTEDGKFIPTYQIMPGVTKFDRYGIHVARSLGLPSEITEFKANAGDSGGGKQGDRG